MSSKIVSNALLTSSSLGSCRAFGSASSAAVGVASEISSFTEGRSHGLVAADVSPPSQFQPLAIALSIAKRASSSLNASIDSGLLSTGAAGR